MVLGVAVTFGQQSNVQITPYGYIKFDSTYDTARTTYGDLAFWVRPETAVGGDERELNFSARETRLGLNIAAPETGGFKTTGRIEVDFYDGIASQTAYSLRMRLAYIDLAWNNGWSLRLGQDWDVYNSFHPDMVDASALAYQGHLYSRHPQVRVTKDMNLGDNTALTAKFAVQYGRNGSDVDGDSQPDETAASSPNFHGGLVLKTRLLSDRQSVFTISGAYGREKLNGSDNPGTYESRLVHGGVQLPLSQQLTLQGVFWKGANLDNYLGGIGQGINSIKGTEVSTYGAWGQLSCALTQKVRVSVGYGVEDPDDEDLEDMPAQEGIRVHNDRFFTNFFFTPTDRLTFGAEYSLVRTDYADSRDMKNHRANFSAQFRF